MICKYAVKSGAPNAPSLLNVHGWMQTAWIEKSFLGEEWALMSHDYCGDIKGRTHFTQYSPALMS